MKLLFKSEFDKMPGIKCVLVKTDFTNSFLQEILLKDIDTEKLSKAVSCISKSIIQEINLDCFRYKINNELVPLNYLSSGEFYFFIAEVSRQTGEEIVFLRACECLTDKNIKLFMDMFRDANITLVVQDYNLDIYLFIKEYGEEIGIW